MTKALVIQGIVDPECLQRYLDAYLYVFDEIVVSTYPEPHFTPLIPSLEQRGVRVVLSSMDPYGAYNFQNLYFQALTTLRGAAACTADYCLKVRGDEFYSNLDTFEYNPDKMFVNNYFLSTYLPDHISDHVIGMPILDMRSTMQRVLSGCAEHRYSLTEDPRPSAEQRIFQEFMSATGRSRGDSWMATAHKHLEVAYLQELEPLLVSNNSLGMRYTTAAGCYTNPHMTGDQASGIRYFPAPASRRRPPRSLSEYTKGWLVGDFAPALLHSKDVEVGVKYYKAGDLETRHVHMVAVEHTIVLSGRVCMNGVGYGEKSIITIRPGVPTDFQCMEDAITLVVKSPSLPQDKYPA